jgi:transposase InsO family protein
MNPKISTVLMEANILIEYWRIEYNQVRSHRALDYFPHSP